MVYTPSHPPYTPVQCIKRYHIVPVALGSDFNPNAHCLSMPLVMNQACVLMRMTMNEVLVAATLNAAASLRRSETHGSLEVGLSPPQSLIYLIHHSFISCLTYSSRIIYIKHIADVANRKIWRYDSAGGPSMGAHRVPAGGPSDQVRHQEGEDRAYLPSLVSSCINMYIM